ncbi:hypothetical protein, partial [Bartonella sp. AD328YNZD]|uniref:hypothetical protein n=1 Tax=Bartonella sp. AD328YNZD TaxID=3243464 RepID=UPI0035D09AA9
TKPSVQGLCALPASFSPINNLPIKNAIAVTIIQNYTSVLILYFSNYHTLFTPPSLLHCYNNERRKKLKHNMAFPFQKSYISHKIVARLSMQGQANKIIL